MNDAFTAPSPEIKVSTQAESIASDGSSSEEDPSDDARIKLLLKSEHAEIEVRLMEATSQ